jgi:hypothetical protein
VTNGRAMIEQGNHVADYVFYHTFRPVREESPYKGGHGAVAICAGIYVDAISSVTRVGDSSTHAYRFE